MVERPFERARYSRQEAFISPEEHKKLGESRILLAGCGAGSTLAPHLARVGYATSERGLVILADPDVVDVANLNRQSFPEVAVGKNKAQVLESVVKRDNSSVRTRSITEGITLDNVASLVSESDVIIDMIDVAKPEVMIALHREAKKQRKPALTGFDVGEGTISLVFDYRDPSRMTLDKYLGLENVSIEELSTLSPESRTGIAMQCMIGPVEYGERQQNSPIEIFPAGIKKRKSFSSIQDVQDYYSSLPSSDTHRNALKEKVPEEMSNVLDKITNGELEFIPQSNTSAGLLGLVHESLVRKLVLNKPLAVAPDRVTIDFRKMIDNEISPRPSTDMKEGLLIPESEGYITSGILVDKEELVSRRKLVAENYLSVGYITSSDPNIKTDGSYEDIWESISYPLGARKNGHIISSMRLIPNTPELGLPINKKKDGVRDFAIDPQYLDAVENAPFEVSQLARSFNPNLGADITSVHAVIRSFISFMQKQEHEYAVAMIDDQVVNKYLNGHIGFNLPVIGEPVSYMGSESVPVMINVNDVIRNSKQKKIQVGQFFEQGQGVAGFEWYKGI